MLAVRLRLVGFSGFKSVVVSVVACSALSAGIELFQLPLRSRVASAADWLFNTISGIAGASAGAVWGRKMWQFAVNWLKRAWETRPVDIATIVLLVLLAADALSPYLPTILLKQVWHNLQQARIDLADGFRAHPWHWWIVTRAGVYAILALMLTVWNGRKGRDWREVLQAAMVVAAFALCLEVGKLMIVSRTFNVANVVASLIGCAGAMIVVFTGSERMSARFKVGLACVALPAYLFYLAWTPLDFIWDLDMIRRIHFSPVQLLPFYHYAMGAGLNSARLFVQSVLLLAIFVYLLRVRWGCFEPSRAGIVLAALFAALLGLLVEGGQIFLPSRTPSMTDVYCYAIGGGLGAWVPTPGSHRLVSPKDQAEAFG
jgi:VanZ family protein